MKTIHCTMEIEEDTGIVTIRGRHGEIYAKIRCEMASFGTFTRVEQGYDCDNFWIGVKPADSEVFNNGLFDTRKRALTVKNIEWVLS